MSISRSRRGGGATEAEDTAGRFCLPLTVSRAPLLERGSDKRFRQLVYDLLTIAARMNAAREHLARGMGLSAPQYSVLMAIGQWQGEAGVSVGSIAGKLHVSSAFIATETGKLAQAGLIAKRPNPKDRRGVLLNLTRTACVLIERNSSEIRAVNDAFFGTLDRGSFAALSMASAGLVHSSQRAMTRLKARSEPSATLSEAAE
jgi:DNA-binding MarR family transcriptional regulator